MKTSLIQSKGIAFSAVLFLLTLFLPFNTNAQTIHIGAGYHSSDNLTGYTVNMDYSYFKNQYSPIGYRFGGSFGPANGIYGGDLSGSYIQSEITKQMQGNSLSSYDVADDTGGGFIIGGKLLFSYRNTRDSHKLKYFFSIGPRLSYFTQQEVDVTTVSTGGGNEYTEFIQLDYQDPVLIPGIELNFHPYGFITFQYAYLFQGENKDPMHMFGLAMPIGNLSH